MTQLQPPNRFVPDMFYLVVFRFAHELNVWRPYFGNGKQIRLHVDFADAKDERDEAIRVLGAGRARIVKLHPSRVEELAS